MPFVTVEHPGEKPFRMFWKTEGSGPVLMLVRGLARSHRYFEPIVPYLTDHFTVLQFDNRGSGQSDCPSGLYTCAQMAEDCRAVLDDAGVDQAWVLGMSLGGMIAFDLAHAHPDRVAGLVLGSMTARGKGTIAPPFWTQVRLVGSAILPKKMARQVQAEITLSPHFIDRAEATMDRWDELAREDPFHWWGLVAQGVAIRTHDSVDRLADVHCPTLVLAGRQDQLVPWENSVFVHERLSNSELVVVDESGHNIETEQPQRMSALITDFVSRHGVAPLAQAVAQK